MYAVQLRSRKFKEIKGKDFFNLKYCPLSQWKAKQIFKSTVTVYVADEVHFI